uniref:Uncharacterized protein n=1 Tax=Heterorhabditis bacteriophora TaxID=37862 RepID=A0A1I7W604_HETBA
MLWMFFLYLVIVANTLRLSWQSVKCRCGEECDRGSILGRCTLISIKLLHLLTGCFILLFYICLYGFAMLFKLLLMLKLNKRKEYYIKNKLNNRKQLLISEIIYISYFLALIC